MKWERQTPYNYSERQKRVNKEIGLKGLDANINIKKNRDLYD